MRLLTIFAAILLASCQSAPTKARKIMAPVAKKAERAGKLAEKQKVSIGRLKASVAESVATAEKLNAERPDGDTARLILSLRIAASETDALRGSNEESRKLRTRWPSRSPGPRRGKRGHGAGGGLSQARLPASPRWSIFAHKSHS
jgi:hypothetical protein